MRTNSQFAPHFLEHFQKNCSPAVREGEKAVFWGSGFVSAQFKGLSNLRLRQRPMIGTTRQNPKILAPHGYSFSSNALTADDKDFLGSDALGVAGLEGFGAQNRGTGQLHRFVVEQI